jgi:hypothetical protein
MGWVISFTILTTVIMILRYLAARIQKRGFYADDVFVIAAYVSSVLLTCPASGYLLTEMLWPRRWVCLPNKVLVYGESSTVWVIL